MAESVKVAVRVRPFNKRELEMGDSGGSKICIQMNGNMTTIQNLDPKPNEKASYSFSFDYSYWSHDDFEDQDGLMVPISSKYADQQRVFNELGVSVLDNAFEGYNTCLFAYGQTGSGKSYSMIGYGKNKGIVPMACEMIFTRIESNTNPNLRFEVSVSMLEIYNELIQDLLVNPKFRKDKTLKIGEDPELGPYVMDLSSYLVSSADEILKKLDDGNRNRTVGETKMNQTSSRAHTVFRVNFKQIELVGSEETHKTSDINLIDLAGSERAGSTGAQGDRLKEGSNINQSLSTLGRVISALADKASGKLPKSAVIPYRESKLTRILQSALGGNSKTTMIAALSPSFVNYEETLSTLRYADRVKQIKNNAKQNTDPASEELRRLQEENQRLLALLEGKGPISLGSGGLELEEIKKEYERKMKAMEERNLSYEERLKRSREQSAMNNEGEEAEAESGIPELRNVSDDPQLTGRLRYILKEGKSKIGRSSKDSNVTQPDIPIVASGILPDHALIETAKTSEEGDEEEEYESKITAYGKVLVNGDLLPAGSSRTLFHKDVISFGPMKFFIFWEPQNIDKAYPEWDDITGLNSESAAAQLGMAALDDNLIKEEVEKKVKAEQEKLDKEKRLVEEQMLEFEKVMKKREFELANKDRSEALKIKDEIRREKEAQKRELEEQQRKLDLKQKEIERLQNDEKNRMEEDLRAKRILEQTIAKALLCVDDANNMADDLNHPVLFSVKLVHKSDTNANGSVVSTGMTFQRTQILIKVDRFEEDVVHFWPLDFFEERLYSIKDLWNDWLAHDTGSDSLAFEMPETGSKDDPFASDPDTSVVVGHAQFYLDPIRSLLSIERETIPIFDYKGSKEGEISVGLLIELDDGGSQEELDDLDSIEDLIGRPVRLTLMVDQGFDLPERYSRNISVSCKWIDDIQDVVCVANLHDEATQNPKFNLYKEFVIPVTEETIPFFQNDLNFEVTGMVPLKANPNNNMLSTSPLKSMAQTRRSVTMKADDFNLESKLAAKEKETEALQKKLNQHEVMMKKLEAASKASGKPMYDENGEINQDLCKVM